MEQIQPIMERVLTGAAVMTNFQHLRKKTNEELAYLMAITNEDDVSMMPLEAAMRSIMRVSDNLKKMSEIIQKEMLELSKPKRTNK